MALANIVVPDKLYRRIYPPHWKYRADEDRVLPSSDEFEPHREDGGISVGVGSLITLHQTNPTSAMLWGDYGGFGLVEVDLGTTLGLGFQIIHAPEPLPPAGEGMWHANLFTTKTAKDLEKQLKELAKKSIWVEPPHDVLLKAAFDAKESEYVAFEQSGAKTQARQKWISWKTTLAKSQVSDRDARLVRVDNRIAILGE